MCCIHDSKVQLYFTRSVCEALIHGQLANIALESERTSKMPQLVDVLHCGFALPIHNLKSTMFSQTYNQFLPLQFCCHVLPVPLPGTEQVVPPFKHHWYFFLGSPAASLERVPMPTHIIQ